MKKYIVFKEDYFIIDENMDGYFAQTEDGSKKNVCV